MADSRERILVMRLEYRPAFLRTVASWYPVPSRHFLTHVSALHNLKDYLLCLNKPPVLIQWYVDWFTINGLQRFFWMMFMKSFQALMFPFTSDHVWFLKCFIWAYETRGKKDENENFNVSNQAWMHNCSNIKLQPKSSSRKRKKKSMTQATWHWMA